MFKDNEYGKIIAVNISILTIIAVAYLLYIGSFLILPFVIAVLLSFGIITVSGFFHKIGMNKFFSYLFSGFSFFIFLFVLGWIINTNINEITKPDNIIFYQNRLDVLSTPILDYLTKFNVNESVIREKIINSIDFSNLFGTVTGAITSIVSNAGIIIIYVLFILLEYRFFKEKIELMSSDIIKRTRTNSIISKIKSDVRIYFLIKTIVSFTTGILSYLVLVVFKIDFALFWAFSIFILNFIPTVGSIIAVGIVSIFAIIQFGFNFSLLILVVLLIGIQILIGNIIEPKLMGNKLNLSPLVILLSLGLWGSIWGIIGMLLSVPIMVIINIVLSKFESTKAISILLSEKGIIEIDEEINIHKTKNKIYKIVKNKFAKKK